MLEVAGRPARAPIEFHSFSKMFNIRAGGWALPCGGAARGSFVVRFKANVDSGAARPPRSPPAWALSGLPAHGPALRGVYRERRDAALDGLRRLRCPVRTPGGAFFVWGRVPEGERALDFSSRLFEATGVMLTPGTGFGEAGEGYFRVSLTSPVESIRRALQKLEGLTPWRSPDVSASAAIR